MNHKNSMSESYDFEETPHLLDYWRIVRKRWLLASTVWLAILAGAVIYAFTATPLYQASAQILLTKALSRSIMNAELSENMSNQDADLRMETELKILGGDPIYESVLASLHLSEAERGTGDYLQTLARLRRNISVERPRSTNLIEVTATNTSPDTAALIANTVVQAYIELYKERLAQASRSTAQWLFTQMTDLEQNVRKSQQELLDYVTRERITFIADGSGLESELKSDMFRAPNETLLERINIRLFEAKATRDEMLQRYKDKHPRVIEAEANVAALEREYRLELGRLAEERRQLTDRIIEARKKSVQYDILRRQVDTNKELFDLFTKKMQEIDLTKGLGEGDIQITEQAVAPKEPAKPKKMLLLALGLLLSMVGGIGAAFLADYMDRSLKSREEIEEVTGLPVLSSIGILKENGNGLDYQNYFTDQRYREERDLFRVLRANVKYTDLKQSSKTLVITSSVPGEGKSTVAVRLAINLAAAGERVLLIDADLRKPSVHKSLKLDNSYGLSNLLVRELPEIDFIHKNLIKGLDVLTSGPIPAQPTEMLEDPLLVKLLDYFKQHYDRIIIDSAPVGTVIDTAVLSTSADGVLMVMDPRMNDWRILKVAQNQMQKMGVRILGIVLNKIPRSHDSYYYYSYHYYYGEDNGNNARRRSNGASKKEPETVRG